MSFPIFDFGPYFLSECLNPKTYYVMNLWKLHKFAYLALLKYVHKERAFFSMLVLSTNQQSKECECY
mgnify:FL=1